MEQCRGTSRDGVGCLGCGSSGSGAPTGSVQPATELLGVQSPSLARAIVKLSNGSTVGELGVEVTVFVTGACGFALYL